MKTLFKVSEQTLWQLFGKLATSVSTFILLGLVARNFGESGTGALTLALTYLTIFYLLADMGINAHVIKEYGASDFEKDWRRLLGFRVLNSLILIGLAILIAFFLPLENNFKQMIIWGSPAIIGSAVFVTVSAIYQSKLRYDLAALTSAFGGLISLGITFVVIQTKNEASLIIGPTLGWLGCGVLALLLAKKFIKNITPLLNFKFIQQLLLETWPIFLVMILNILYFRIDSFLLAKFKNISEVGIYNLPYQIFQTLLVVPTFIMNGFYPIMIESFQLEKRNFVSQVKKAMGIMLILALCGALLTNILSPLIISLISGGKGFAGSYSVLQILALGFPGFFISSIFMWLMIVLKKYKSMLVIYLIGLLVNVFLNWVYIPQFSYIASAYITIFSEYLILVLQAFILTPLLLKISK